MRLLLVLVVVASSGCGFKEPGNFCDESADCLQGLACMQTTQTGGSTNCTGIIQPKLCTRSCSSDADCTSIGLKCNRASTCRGPADRCGI